LLNISCKTSLKHLLIIFTLTAGLYLPSLKGEFVYDDHETIVKNPYIKNLNTIPAYFDPRNTKMWSFHDKQRQFYRPIPLTTFAINYRMGRLNPFSYRVLNVLMHILTAFGVYFAVYYSARLFDTSTHSDKKETRLAFLSSLFFAIHPMQTESVTYVVSRSVIICALFLLCALVTFLRTYEGAKKNKRLFYIVSLVCFVLALCSKEIAIVFPLFIFVCAWLNDPYVKTHRAWSRVFTVCLPYVIILVIYLVSRSIFLGKNTISSLIGTHLIRYFATSIKTVFIYLKLLIIPTGQNVDHFLPIVQSISEPRSILAFAFFAIIVWCLFTKILPYSRFLFFWGLWYFISFLPNLLLPTSEAISEHTVYFPSIGFFVAVVYISMKIGARYGSNFGRVKRIIGMGIVLVVATQLMFLTLHRNLVWQSAISLWKDAVKKSPHKDRPHVNLGLAYLNDRRYDDSLLEFEKALSVNPNNIEAMNNMGIVYSYIGKYQKAEEAFTESIALERKNPNAYNNLGFLFLVKGHYESSIPILKKALIINPDDSVVLSNLGLAHVKSGYNEKGCGYLNRAVDINPDDKRARILHNTLCISH